MCHPLSEYLYESLKLGTESKLFILPIRVELLGNVIVFVGLELFQKVCQCEYSLGFEGHHLLIIFSMRDARVAGGAESLIGAWTSPLIEESLSFLETLVYLIEFGKGLAILRCMVIFD